ncbi:hypothetical protein Hanom_Chr08g00756321 [Helianthus anomalus]
MHKVKLISTTCSLSFLVINHIIRVYRASAGRGIGDPIHLAVRQIGEGGRGGVTA